MLDLKNAQKPAQNIVLPNETNFNIHFYINVFLRAIDKTPYWKFWGIFLWFCAIFFFFNRKQNYRSKLSDWWILYRYGYKTALLAKIRGPKMGFLNILLNCVYFLPKWPYNYYIVIYNSNIKSYIIIKFVRIAFFCFFCTFFMILAKLRGPISREPCILRKK